MVQVSSKSQADAKVTSLVTKKSDSLFAFPVLHFSIRETGYFSGIPQLIAIFIKIGCGRLLDCKFGCSQKMTLSIPLIVLEALSAASLFLTGFLDDRTWALVCMMIFASLHFFVPVICSRTIQIRAAQHAHFALNMNMVIAGITQIIIPLGVQAAAPDNSRSQWSAIFYTLTAVVICTTLLYTFMARAVPAEWTKSHKSDDYTIYRLSETSAPEPLTIPMPSEYKN